MSNNRYAREVVRHVFRDLFFGCAPFAVCLYVCLFNCRGPYSGADDNLCYAFSYPDTDYTHCYTFSYPDADYNRCYTFSYPNADYNRCYPFSYSDANDNL